MALAVTIPSVKPGNPALYHILISLGPSYSYEIDHRFNDFWQLAEDAKQEIGEDIPVPPPPKPGAWEAWRQMGGSTAEQLEDRRISLESTLRALVRDPKFGASLALARFLDLNKHRHRHTAQTKGAPGSANTLIATDWLQTTAQLSKLVSEARQLAMQAGSSAAARAKCTHAKVLIDQLQRNLNGAKGGDEVGPGEKQRRQQHLDQWSHNVQKLEMSLFSTGGSTADDVSPNSEGGYPTHARHARESAAGMADEALSLFRNNVRQGRAIGGPVEQMNETEITRQYNNAGLLSVQQNTVQQQDVEIESLRQAIGRQRDLGLAISDELTKQSQLLDELDDDVHRVNARLNEAKVKTAKLQ